MTTANYITRLELREELQKALSPVHERLDHIEGNVQSAKDGVESVKEDMVWLKGHVQDLQIDMGLVKIKMGI